MSNVHHYMQTSWKISLEYQTHQSFLLLGDLDSRVTQSLTKQLHFVPSSPVLSVSKIVPTPTPPQRPSQKTDLMGNCVFG